MRLRLGASGAGKLCALGALGAPGRPLNFTVLGAYEALAA